MGFMAAIVSKLSVTSSVAETSPVDRIFTSSVAEKFPYNDTISDYRVDGVWRVLRRILTD
jgi:hypothetical protein